LHQGFPGADAYKQAAVGAMEKAARLGWCTAAACLVGFLALLLHRDISRDLILLIAAHRTYWSSSVTTSMWMKDMVYWKSGPKSALEENTFQFQPHDDHTTRVCRLAIYVKIAEEVHSGSIISPITDSRVTLPPADRAEAFVQACREIFPELPAEQRELLEALEPVPPPWQFHLNVTHPWMSGGHFTHPMYNGMDVLMGQVPGPVSPSGSEVRWAAEREARIAALPSLEDRLKPESELRRLPQRIRQGLEELGIRPVRDVRIEVQDISRAIRAGETAVFDATQLCGPGIFNLTIPDIARLHGTMADVIPAFKDKSGGYGDGTYDTLSELGRRFHAWNEMGWLDFVDYSPFPDNQAVQARDRRIAPNDWLGAAIESFLAWYHKAPRWFIADLMVGDLKLYRQANTQTTVNVRRLKHFPLRDVHKAMGSPDWIERVWNLLWIGPVSDFWHFDEMDNLLICVSGDLFVAVMEQNITDIVSGTRNVNLGFNDLERFFLRAEPGKPSWVESHPWIRKVPIHFMKLEPGMGITVPSRTYHNVMAYDGNRVLMNAFMIPKWRAVEDAPAAHNSWFGPGRQAPTYRALWHLKFASICRLWDTKKVGGFFGGYKLEIF